MMKRVAVFFCGAFIPLILISGCLGDSSAKNPDPKPVSTTAWGKRESWEGQGALGGMGLGQGR